MDGVIINNKMYRTVPFDECENCDIKDICINDTEDSEEYGFSQICHKFESEYGERFMFEEISGNV